MAENEGSYISRISEMVASSSCCLRRDIFNPDLANRSKFWHIFADEPDNHGGLRFWQLTLQWQTGDKFAFHVDGSHGNSEHSRHAILIPGHMHPFNIAGSWKIHEPVWRHTHTHTQSEEEDSVSEQGPAVDTMKGFTDFSHPPGVRPRLNPTICRRWSPVRRHGSAWWQPTGQPAATPHSPIDANKLSKVTD